MKRKYTSVVIILTYRNIQDIHECVESIKAEIEDTRIIIVNSHYDEDTAEWFREFAKENDCDYIDIENKGYGYGNNKGIEYAKKYYSFDYVIISNPDIIVKKYDFKSFNNINAEVIAPVIITKTGKNQNPYWIIKTPNVEKLIYRGYCRDNRKMIYLGYGINKLLREFGLFCFKILKKHKMKVYAPHGSFCVFRSKIIEENDRLYDEEMFLFAEEAYLAHYFESNNHRVVLTDYIEVFHKEDGSIKLSNINLYKTIKESTIHYYRKYVVK